MATPSAVLIRALRVTAERLAAGAAYQWGHHGQCNCGHLVQTLCDLTPGTIHAWALDAHARDWETLANDYCPTSGHAIDAVIASLLAAGLTTDDLSHLERLDDDHVLSTLPGGKRWLSRNLRDDVIAYLLAWADSLSSRLPLALAA